MVKVCLVFNSLTDANGVARAAVAIANLLASSGQYKVTLIPLYNGKKCFSGVLNDNVDVSPFLQYYFRGLPHLLDLLPNSLLYKLIVRHKYDIEIGFQFGLSTKVISASNSAATKIAWMHGYDNGLKLRSYYPKFKKILCVSKHNADRLKKEMAMPSLDIEYCYNTIDDIQVSNFGEEALDEPLPPGFKFVSVGRFSKEKGYTRLPKIVNKLRNEGYTFSIVLVGDGPDQKLLQQEINQLGLDEYFYFCGIQTNPHKYTSKCDLFVCPSYTEGYSNACTESIMLGVPVLTTDVPGGAEIIDDADCGMLVCNDDSALYEGMRFALDHEDIVTSWKEKLKETKYKFSQQYRTDHLFQIMKDL